MAGMSYGTAIQGAGDLIGLGIGAAFGDSIYGKKPKVAPWKPVSIGPGAIQTNLSDFGNIAQLGDLYTSYLQDSISKVLPEYKSILAEGGQTTQDILQQADPLIKGELPEDVKSAVERNSAYESLLSGTAGSSMAKGLTARDLGLTSLDLMQRGTQMAGEAGNAMQRWNQIASGTVYDPQNMFVTPAQKAAIDLKNEEEKQAAQQNRFNVAAAPNPTAQGLYNTYLSMLSQVGGGGGGRGSGGGSMWGGTSDALMSALGG